MNDEAFLNTLNSLSGIGFTSWEKSPDSNLAAQAEILRTLIDSLPDNIYVKDCDGRFVLCNRSVARLFGVAHSDEVIGRTDFDFHPLENARRYRADELRILKTGEPMSGYEETVIDHDGTELWYSTSKIPLRNRAGAIIGLMGIGRDITSRKKAEAQVIHYADHLARQHKIMQADLNLARDFQRSILKIPETARAMTVNSSGLCLSMAQYYIPNEMVSGDFIDIRCLTSSRVAILVCDAIGHGVRAAFLTAILNGLVASAGELAHDPAGLLGMLHRQLREVTMGADDALFITAIYAIIDLKEGLIHFANAGHPDPLKRERGTGKVTPLAIDSKCPALGLLETAVYCNNTQPVRAGDVFLFFTDGLFEIPSSDGELFGCQRIIDVLGDSDDRTAEQWIERVTDLAHMNEGGERCSFTDDVAAVAVLVTENP